MPVPVELTAGPFRGMRDAEEPLAGDPTLARTVLNMCRIPGIPNAGLIGRPGFAKMQASTVLGGPGTTQSGLTWADVNGVRITTVICGGKVYAYDWTAGTFSEPVTAANLSTKSITLSSSAKVSLVPFANGLVVSDGVNVPFWWDGTTGATGLTKLTACPPLYGPPTVYYSALVGIKAANRNTMVWSEPGQPNVGYEAGGYNNAWDNPGGYADPLTSVAGTNEALYVFRARVSLAILGAISFDWVTAGTRANLSVDVGTLSPWGTLVVSQGVIVADAAAQPWLFRYGATEPAPLWLDCRNTVAGTPRAALAAVETIRDDATDSILIGLPEVGQTKISHVLCFAQSDLQFVGRWSWGASADTIFPVTDDQGVPRWAHAGVGDGVLYAHGELDAAPRDDGLVSGIRYIAHAVGTHSLGYDVDRELMVNQIEAGVTGTSLSAVAVSYETPRGTSLPQTLSLTAEAAGLRWDVGKWDEEVWATSVRDQRVRCGTFGRGRWVRLNITHGEDGEGFALSVFRARCSSRDGNPRVP